MLPAAAQPPLTAMQRTPVTVDDNFTSPSSPAFALHGGVSPFSTGGSMLLRQAVDLQRERRGSGGSSALDGPGGRGRSCQIGRRRTAGLQEDGKRRAVSHAGRRGAGALSKVGTEPEVQQRRPFGRAKPISAAVGMMVRQHLNCSSGRSVLSRLIR